MYKWVRATIVIFLLSSFKLLLHWPVIASAAQPSRRGVYTTYSNGTTTLAVAENIEFGDFESGYQTVIQGKPIWGWLRIERIEQDKTYTYLSGSFNDICTGQIRIRRPNPQSGLAIVAEVTWIVTRQSVEVGESRDQNQNCEAPTGQKFQVRLPEALPEPDDRGEFTNENSNTFLFNRTAFYTWTQWQVISADGMLNCRDRPNGVVKHIYRKGQIIQKLGFEHREGLNIVEMTDGSSWLKTKERCYVRASKQFLKPVSLPIRTW